MRRNPQKSLHKGRKADFTSSKYWKAEARTHLYRSKRCRKLADLLMIRRSFQQHGLSQGSQRTLSRAIQSAAMRSSIGQLTRMVKAEHVGIDMLDITVCGALAPYNLLLGGKLLQVKPRTVYFWVYKRSIPYERKGGSLRFRLDAIEKWNVPRAA